MSGAPVARTFDVSFPDGKTKRYRIEPRIFSDTTIGSLRAILIKRKRAARQELLSDFAVALQSLSPEAQASFLKEALAEAKKEQDPTIEEIDALLASLDKEALATILWSCSPDIESFEEAVSVYESHQNIIELLDLVSEVVEAEAKAAGNLPRHPVKESRGRATKNK